jgi:hypothetical protein
MVWSSISKVVLSADDGKPSVYVVAEEGDKEKLLIGLKGNAWGGREKMNGMFIFAIGADEKSFDYDIDKIFNDEKMPEDLFLHAVWLDDRSTVQMVYNWLLKVAMQGEFMLVFGVVKPGTKKLVNVITKSIDGFRDTALEILKSIDENIPELLVGFRELREFELPLPKLVFLKHGVPI